MTMYSETAVMKLVQHYLNHGGELFVLEEGTLMEYGLAVLTGPKMFSFIISERYINAWKSGYSVRKYRVLPQKYVDLIEKVV